ncbi:hypothetical protein EBME_2141 [bacterium endosymbiont of Mortierella elongata FMR23-6]|nr:hypothetical protein EBME_2141 [bacterium endosymbiont of Mortierella elongata FMR23-6]
MRIAVIMSAFSRKTPKKALFSLLSEADSGGRLISARACMNRY